MNFSLAKSTALIICLALSPVVAQEKTSFDSIPPASSEEPASGMKSNQAAYAWVLGGGLALPVAGGVVFGFGEKSNNLAVWDLGALMLFSGLAVGPSFGQFYAGSVVPGLLATAGRTVGALMITAGIASTLDFCGTDFGGNDTQCPDRSNDGTTLVVLGTLLFLGSDIYSLVDTHFAVQRHNEKLKAQHFGFSPELFPSNDGGLKPGVLAWAKF